MSKYSFCELTEKEFSSFLKDYDDKNWMQSVGVAKLRKDYGSEIKYLGVKKNTLESYGAVSEQTVSEMLMGGLNLANANVALAVSGLAGPGGATDTKPVGLVYVGCMVEDKKVVEKHIFKGDRTSIREQTTKRAIELAIEMLEKRN